jgi:hypothetical protein
MEAGASSFGARRPRLARAALILIDRRGYERSAYLYPFGQQFVTHDRGVLGREPAPGSA